MWLVGIVSRLISIVSWHILITSRHISYTSRSMGRVLTKTADHMPIPNSPRHWTVWNSALQQCGNVRGLARAEMPVAGGWDSGSLQRVWSMWRGAVVPRIDWAHIYTLVCCWSEIYNLLCIQNIYLYIQREREREWEREKERERREGHVNLSSIYSMFKCQIALHKFSWIKMILCEKYHTHIFSCYSY